MRFSLTGSWNNLTYLQVHNYVSPAVFSCIILLLSNLKIQYIHVHVHIPYNSKSIQCNVQVGELLCTVCVYGPNSSVVMFGVLYKCTRTCMPCIMWYFVVVTCLNTSSLLTVGCAYLVTDMSSL